jgi:hypothetical protein
MATIGQLGARSDLEALRKSGRGKLLILAAVIVAAIVGAFVSFTEDVGTGNPEDPGKVLIVRRGQTAGYVIVLKDAGFDAAEGTFDDWVRKAEEEVPELETTGVAAIMELADRFGYGYVAFERPQEIDFSEVDADVPRLEEHVRFVVISVGDLAFPPEVTVNPPPSQVMRDPGLVLLQALFEQEVLGRALEESDSDLDAIKLRDRLLLAVARIERIPEAERMAQGIVRQTQAMLVDDERASPKPEPLGDPLESLTANPLADGTILMFSRRLSIVSADGVLPNLDLAAHEEFLFRPEDGSNRRTCTSLSGGVLSDADSPRYRVAADGTAVLLRTLSQGMVLWKLSPPPPPPQPGQPAEPDPGCTFERVGTVPPAEKGVDRMGIPSGEGLVARAGTSEGRGVVSVVQAGRTDRTLLGQIDAAKLRGAAWVAKRHIVARGDHDGDMPDAIYFLSVEDPLTVLALEATAFESASSIGQIAVGPVFGGRQMLVVTAGDEQRRLFLVDLPATVPALFENPPVAEGQEPLEREGLPKVIPLDAAAFELRALTHRGQARDPVLSPDGRHVAFALVDPDLDRPDEAEDEEIALVDLSATPPELPRMRLLTRNDLQDLGPAFTADGRTIVFGTRVRIPRTSWVITAGRTVAVPMPQAVAQPATEGGDTKSVPADAPPGG